MPDYNASEFFPSNFHAAARPEVPVIQPQKVDVTVGLDADVLAWLQSPTQPSNWKKVINDQMRFLMETEMQTEADRQGAIAAMPPHGPSYGPTP